MMMVVVSAPPLLRHHRNGKLWCFCSSLFLQSPLLTVIQHLTTELTSVLYHLLFIMAPSLLLLLGLLCSGSSLSPPRTSFLLGSADRPLVHFGLPDVHDTATLLLSGDASTLYVGAQDTVLSLDVNQSDVISLRGQVQWSPSQTQIQECQAKGKNMTVDCPNFVHVLQLINSTHLYACGSFAFSPRDAIIDTDSFNMVRQGEAKGRCPFSPLQRSTAITVDGELFTATTSDFRGAKPQISRHFSKDGRPDVSQDSVSLLAEPTFVGSSADVTERKLYFFFTEVGKEFSFVDDLQTARVAQVCKDDIGGQRTLQKKWTSFAKATLLCQSHRQLPFNVLQDVFTLPPSDDTNSADTLFYGVFTSQWSSGPGSAVCVFRLQDVQAAFSGDYMTFDMQSHQWRPFWGKQLGLGKCGLDGASDSDLAEVKKNFLTNTHIKPVSGGPLVVSSGQSYSRVTAMRTTAADGKKYTVLFLLTESGFLHKVVLFDQGSQVIEEIQVFTKPQLVKSIVLSSTKGVLYVGTSEAVTAVPVARCATSRTCSQCIQSRDPFCGWSPTRRTCTSLGSSPETLLQDLENGNAGERCQHQTRTGLDSDVVVVLNQVVTLPCLKPSNLASLSWMSPQFTELPENLFFQLADGSLRFLATAATLGTYRCQAEEGGFKDIVVGYIVKQAASPRAISPDHINAPDKSGIPEKLPVTELLGEPEDEEDTLTDSYEKETKDSEDGRSNLTLGRDNQSSEKDNVSGKGKSFHRELVVVSVLLVLCICILVLGGILMSRQQKTKPKPNCLVSPDPGPELKVVD
ncbi:semaphorin-4A-like [Echeneis naucrates]|uniref:Semaphorin-4A-like n=1 Tax=Echeneis naucrates TaxID=173247 RepID=A0A665TF03_ECHNA|nr:semaphorin-4A-like [Echeneis naucrates]